VCASGSLVPAQLGAAHEKLVLPTACTRVQILCRLYRDVEANGRTERCLPVWPTTCPTPLLFVLQVSRSPQRLRHIWGTALEPRTWKDLLHPRHDSSSKDPICTSHMRYRVASTLGGCNCLWRHCLGLQQTSATMVAPPSPAHVGAAAAHSPPSKVA